LKNKRFPERWPKMKPIKTSPVRAITAFFPIEERAQLQVGVDMDLGALDI
jgi:hypothetical protein